MITLAPICYFKLLRNNSLLTPLTTTPLLIAGERYYQVLARLGPGVEIKRPRLSVFGTADGTGTDRTRILARYKAISEALERWALYASCEGEAAGLYGLETDWTSTGFAAFPGLTAGAARRLARREAIERFCLAGWWKGLLGNGEETQLATGHHQIQLENPLSRDAVVIQWIADKGGFHAYGFGCGRRLAEASERALVELERTRHALAHYYSRHPGITEGALAETENAFERRVLYFSRPVGHEAFLRRLRTKPRRAPRGPVRPTIDTEVRGPWSRYTRVWRVLYAMPDDAYLDPDSTVFYW